MKIYFATSYSQKYLEVMNEAEIDNVLFSFAFFKTLSQVKKIFKDYYPKNIIVDSGAFSTWTRNEKIDIDEYADFCFKVKEHFKDNNIYFVNLDVLPGKFGKKPNDSEREKSAEEGWQNMLYLESKGLKVIPVFHQHEDFKWLDKMKKHTNYVGISPANDVSMNEKLNFLNQVFSMIKNTIKTHGFAVTSYKQLFKYPFYSVDSSSWTSPSRFGSIPIFDNYQMKVFKYKDKKKVKDNWQYLSQLGMEKLSDKEWKHRILLSIKSYLELEKKATELWDRRGINYEK